MADLSEINLDEDGENPATLSSRTQGVEVSSTQGTTSAPAHSTTEDLHLYFRQDWKARLGMTGIVITFFFALMLALSFALLVVSYTPVGRSFLQTLKFFIF